MKFADLTTVDAVDGVLTLRSTTEVLDLDLGPLAERWRDKIRNPKSLIDKLGVKAGQRIAVLRVADADFLTQLKAVQPEFACSLDAGLFDIVFYSADSPAELARLPEIAAHLAPKGGMWVVARKGKAASVKDYDVINAGRSAGLVDVKVAAFSSTHTALKFVPPAK